MLTLAIDSCGPACAVGLWQDGKILVQAQEEMERGQDARLMPMIVELLRACSFAFSDLDRIAVTRGPGSFTGARVGLAAARGIGLAAKKPVIGIDRFAIYHVMHLMADKNILVVIDSKRAELFCKYFPITGALPEACLMTQEQVDAFVASHPNTVIVGDMKTREDNVIAACAELAASAEEHDPAFAAQPLYLRAPDVSFARSAIALDGYSSTSSIQSVNR